MCVTHIQTNTHTYTHSHSLTHSLTPRLGAQTLHSVGRNFSLPSRWACRHWGVDPVTIAMCDSSEPDVTRVMSPGREGLQWCITKTTWLPTAPGRVQSRSFAHVTFCCCALSRQSYPVALCVGCLCTCDGCCKQPTQDLSRANLSTHPGEGPWLGPVKVPLNVH